MGNIFGHSFRIATFGESHGPALGVVIEGCPPRVPFDLDFLKKELARRRPGQSDLTTQRKEEDQPEILSGLSPDGLTLGSPIAIIVRNKDQRPSAYTEMKSAYRPSHADFTYDSKYGIRAVEGGGRSSARETAARVAAGALAKTVLDHACGAKITAWVESVANIQMPALTKTPTQKQVDVSPTRCPHPATAEKIAECIRSARSHGDSVGGVICCVISGLPAGLGSPVFDRFEADLAKAMLSLPATKGFEIGSGFAGTQLMGSQHNDLFVKKGGRIRTATNRSGGTQGGITNGEDVVFRIAFKPTATILQKQKTVRPDGKETSLAAKGRHDPCVLPRAVPIVEAMAALVAVDHWIRDRGQNESFGRCGRKA
ncbi:MAG: chorismate synthase [Opitutae bacterium]